MHACGIDFGTSNSAIASGTKDGARLLTVEDGSETLPSAIFYPHHTNAAPVFGRAAQKLFFEGEEGRFMRSLKRILGTPLMGQGTVVNGRMKKFDEIIRHFISHMKALAEQQLNHALTHAVMGRPVHFSDNDPAADGRAQDELEAIARAAGFAEVSFQFEPVAAAFAHEEKVQSEKRALVADIGGGTSDFTVIKISREHRRKEDRTGDILGHSGARLGGNDFDKSLSLGAFMPELGLGTTFGAKNLAVPLAPFHDLSEWSKVNFLYNPKTMKDARDILFESHAPEKYGRFVKALEREAGHRILSVVEDAKISLTEETALTAALPFLEDGLEIPLTREGFNAAIKAHIRRISRAIDECLKTAGLNDGDIEIVILTGGPTETPLLKETIKSRFPHAELSEDNKLSSVALGLGHDAARKYGKAKAA